jgi:hypothetical protein
VTAPGYMPKPGETFERFGPWGQESVTFAGPVPWTSLGGHPVWEDTRGYRFGVPLTPEHWRKPSGAAPEGPALSAAELDDAARYFEAGIRPPAPQFADSLARAGDDS